MLPRLTLASFLVATPLFAGADARMLQQPDVSATRIAFVYAGDIWTVAKEGGTAHRLSTPAGEEAFPRFSPDGESIAFSGNYDGNQDVYVVPAAGGLPVRVTHHPMPDRMLDWYPDGESLLFASQMKSGRNRFHQLYKTSRDGGLPERLPVPYGEFGAVSPDGETLAYMPATRDFRTWKRYRGGLTTDIWLFGLDDLSARILADADANDGQPMWHGSQVYFLSDRDAKRRYNIWVASADGGEARQVTHFDEHDVHFPAIGPEDLVFENAGRLYRLELATETLHEVEVDVVTDLATLKPRDVEVGELIFGYDLSPSGKRAVLEARGEVFTVPAEHGIVRNLTRSSGFAERFPAWSPDGEKIAYLSDRGGEYEIAVRAADGSGEEEILTSLGPGFRYRLRWSPDSQKIAFVDQAMNIRYYDLEKDQVVDVDKAFYLFEGNLRSFHFDWSPDSRWLTYHRSLERLGAAVFLYDTRAGVRHQVTTGYYGATDPVFDPEGKYLYFQWNRSMVPSYSAFQGTWIYANPTQIAAVPLRADVPSPLAPRNDEEGEEDEKDKDGKKDEGKKDEGKKDGDGDEDADEDDEDGGEGKDEDEPPEPVEIDLDGFESRIVVLPPEAGNYGRMAAAKGKVIYLRLPRTGSTARPFGAGDGDVVFYDLEEREEKTVISGVGDFRLAAGGDKLLVRKDSDFAIVDVKPDQKMEDKLAVGGLETTVDPRAEWRQIFNDVWRFERDYFYDPNLHGVDWQAMRERYGALLDAAVTRWDVNYVIGELIGELNASHAYRGGGDTEEEKRRGVGLLGADFAVENGAYKIADVIDLPPWETEVRSPLREPGVAVEEGDYLLAVNGAPVDVTRDPWAALEGLAGQTVMLTVNGKPSMDGAREVLVETLESEERLRNLAWIEANRQRVRQATGGRVGYVYVPNTGLGGQSELVRQFFGEIDTDGLIVDERFNSGGQIPDRFVELLNRPLLNYWGVRDGIDWQWPPYAHRGPKAMLINGWSGSGGDLFPYYFKATGLGPLIGTRTWGGLIGVSGAPPLIDGGGVTVPTFAAYSADSADSEWIIEGVGVAPDIEVIDDPSAMARGGDPQLERAIEEVMKALEENPPRRPQRPAYDDRSGT
jgi:tricorn protease